MNAPPMLRRLEKYTPPSLMERPIEFVLSIPTSAERDQIGARMYALGVAEVSRETIRATLIDELFNLFEEAAAEQHADFLNDYWEKQVAYEAQLEL